VGRLKWWLRVVGVFYLVQFVAVAIAKSPISVEGPPGLLNRAAHGDPTARFVIDTWITLGVYLGVLGVALLVASRRPGQAHILVWTLVGINAAGILIDMYKITRGYGLASPVIWTPLHLAIIATGIWCMRPERERAPGASTS
jgi:hypothetical protein